MKLEKRENGEWAIIPTGNDSRTRMSGDRGFIVVGEDGQALSLFEAAGKIEMEIYAGPPLFQK